MNTLDPVPPPPARPHGAVWPDPDGRPHWGDRAALDAVERAGVYLKHGDRLGCLRALADYEFLCHCGVSRPDFESRVRGLFVRLGRLPHGHRVPDTVATLADLLAVFAVNQDSPQKAFRVGGGWSYCDAPKGRAEGSVCLTWRVTALVNCGREKPHLREQPGPGDFIGSHVTWDGGEFGRCPADRRGQPRTPEHRRAMAELFVKQWATVLELDRRAGVYGWHVGDRAEWEASLARVCNGTDVDPAKLPPPADVFDRPAPAPAPARKKRTARS